MSSVCDSVQHLRLAVCLLFEAGDALAAEALVRRHAHTVGVSARVLLCATLAQLFLQDGRSASAEVWRQQAIRAWVTLDPPELPATELPPAELPPTDVALTSTLSGAAWPDPLLTATCSAGKLHLLVQSKAAVGDWPSVLVLVAMAEQRAECASDLRRLRELAMVCDSTDSRRRIDFGPRQEPPAWKLRN